MNNLNEDIFFSDENIFSIISDILKKNGLKETVHEAVDKENSLILSTFRSLKKFAEGNLTEKDFILSLQNQLKITDQTAKNLAKDIKEKILPLAGKVKTENQNQTEEQMEKPMPPMPKITERKARVIKSIPKLPEIKIVKNNRTGPDNYREPIE